MKKIISLLLAVLLLLSLTACGRGEEVSPSTEEAPLPETTQPATRKKPPNRRPQSPSGSRAFPL